MGEERRANPNPLSVAGFLAILYTMGYFILTGFLYWIDVPENNEKPLIFLLGLISGPQVAIIQWAFGSSQSGEAAQRAIEQRQGRSEAVVAQIAQSLPAAVAAAVPNHAPVKTDDVNIEAKGNININGAKP